MLSDYVIMITNDWPSQIFEKNNNNNWRPEFGPKGPKLGVFLPFSQVWFISFPWNCNDSLQQCLISSRGKTHTKKCLGPNLGQTSQNRALNYFFSHFLKFGALVFLEIGYDVSLQQYLTSSRFKTHEKEFRGPKLGQADQNRAWN